MAAGAAVDKENAAPSTSAAAVPRRLGYGVRSCGVKKRPCRARWAHRVPLRDITNLIAATSAPAGHEAQLGRDVSPATAAELPKPDAVEPAAAVLRVATAQDGLSSGAAAKKAAIYSLRKEFR